MSVDRPRLWSFLRKSLLWVVPALALLMLALMLVPAEVWRHPADDAIYKGFDPNLVFVTARGDASREGVVQIAPESLKLTALPDSQPTAHLVNTPMSFRVSMNLRILETGEGGTPLSVGIWHPEITDISGVALGGSGYFLDFGPPPDLLITTRIATGGFGGVNLQEGKVLSKKTLGRYSPGQSYHLEMALDKDAGVIQSRLSSDRTSPTGSPVLMLTGGPSNPSYSDVMSGFVRVMEGERYRYGGQVRSQRGSRAYKVNLQWLNSQMKHLSFAGDWRNAQGKDDWTRDEFEAEAPSKAAFARLLLGSGDSSTSFFADLFVVSVLRPNVNLLPNGDFQKGTEGWLMPSNNSSGGPRVIEPSQLSVEDRVTAAEAPEPLRNRRYSQPMEAKK